MAEVKTNLRMPEELYEHIKQFASKDVRSINAQMIVLLQEAVAARGGAGKPLRGFVERNSSALVSEPAFAKDWDRPEERAAWAYLAEEAPATQ